VTETTTTPQPLSAEVPIPEGTLGLVVELCEALETAGVRYCHWKSNDMLDRSARGENDLDLLMHRADGQRFAEVLARLGFREAWLPEAREHPGVSHHYALDAASGRFVHIHAHFQLVLGDDTTKNYRLPLEKAYLASVQGGQLFPVPAPEFELAVFVVRMMLKHATWDAVAFGKGGLGSSERRELAWLTERADPDLTQAVVREHLAGIGVDLWRRCFASLQPAGTLAQRLAAGRALLRALAPHGRRGPATDAWLRVARRGMWGSKHYILRRPTRKRLARVGATVAVVGGDGAGKSTAVAGLADWLDGTFVVRQTHLGKPRPCLLTLAVKGPMYIGRSVGLLPSTGLSVDPRTARPEDFPGRAWALWQLLTARDRRLQYRRARSVADAGGIVVSDRWPLRQITLMDGPRTTWLRPHLNGSRSVVRRLVDAEGRAYAHVAPPDILLVLRLDPEIAVARRTDEDPDFVRRRNTELYGIDWSGSDAVLIDATQPPDEVLAQMRRVVWERL
jgi:Uncharacterised nucleotidyltransferase